MYFLQFQSFIKNSGKENYYYTETNLYVKFSL